MVSTELERGGRGGEGEGERGREGGEVEREEGGGEEIDDLL